MLPVGGVREKSLAALRNGITTIVIPESNVGDLREIPKELKKRLTFIPVKHMREALEHVLVTPPEPPLSEWSRSKLRVVSATFQPSPTGPRRAVSGSRTSSKKTSLKELPPLIWAMGRTSTPGVSMGTRICDCCRCLGASGSVFTMTIMILQRGSPAPEM